MTTLAIVLIIGLCGMIGGIWVEMALPNSMNRAIVVMMASVMSLAIAAFVAAMFFS